MAASTSAEPFFPDLEATSNLVGEYYEAHGRMLVGLCTFLLRDPVEAEDAAQQSFMAAHRSLLGGAVPRDARAWLATIARNECRARIKQRMREPLPLLEPDGTEGQLPDPFHAAAENADFRALRDELEALPETQRNAFVLREFAGLSYEELALALGVTEPAVESLLVRARTKLRLALVHANPLVVPLVIRDQLARLTTGFDDGSAGAVAKLVTVPLAAKLAAMGAGVALVAGGGSLSDRSGAGKIAPAHAPVLIAPADQRIAPARVSHGSSRSSTPTFRAAAARENADGRAGYADDRAGGGAVPASARGGSGAAFASYDDSSAVFSHESPGSGAWGFGSEPTSALGGDDSAPSGNSPQIGDSSSSDGISSGDGGSSDDRSSGDTSTSSATGSAGSQPSSSAEDSAGSTSSESSFASSESEDHHSTTWSGLSVTPGAHESLDDSPTGDR